MDLEQIKRGLRAEIKKRENEQYLTFQCNVRQMCKDVLAKLEEQELEIAELKEAQRWRKYSEEKPRSDGYYIICGSNGFRNADRFMECKDGRGMDFSFYSYGVEYWMPMPKVPDEIKEGE